MIIHLKLWILEEKIEPNKEDEIKDEKIEENKEDIKEDKEISNNNNEINNINTKENNNNTISEKNENEKNNINKQIPQNTSARKKISFKEAQEQIKICRKEFEDLEKKIKNKYGDCFPDFSCEEQLPVLLKTKLITTFFESEEMKNIANKMKQEQK